MININKIGILGSILILLTACGDSSPDEVGTTKTTDKSSQIASDIDTSSQTNIFTNPSIQKDDNITKSESEQQDVLPVNESTSSSITETTDNTSDYSETVQTIKSIPFPTLSTDIALDAKYIPPQ